MSSLINEKKDTEIMILDNLQKCNQYFDVHKGFRKAFEFLQRFDLSELSEGKYEIAGEKIFAIVAKDQGRAAEEGQLEVHNEYIDIQLVVEGTDTMGWRSRTTCCKEAGEYDPETDLQFFLDDPHSWLAVGSGNFAVFFPDDAHLPLISTGLIHKVIVKVAVESDGLRENGLS